VLGHSSYAPWLDRRCRTVGLSGFSRAGWPAGKWSGEELGGLFAWRSRPALVGHSRLDRRDRNQHGDSHQCARQGLWSGRNAISPARDGLLRWPRDHRSRALAALFSRQAVHGVSGAGAAVRGTHQAGGLAAIPDNAELERRPEIVSDGDRAAAAGRLGFRDERNRDGLNYNLLYVLWRHAFGCLERL